MADTTTKPLGLLSLMMMTVISVYSVRNLPAAAMFGSECIGFYLIAAVMFLLPCTWVTSELATTSPNSQGIYAWTKQAFGLKWALLAIWLQWIANIIWYPTLLSFIAGTLGYLIDPVWAQNKGFLIAVILTVFWGGTWVSLRGIETSARFSHVCTVIGLVLPMILILSLGCVWLWHGYPQQTVVNWQTIQPDLTSISTWAILTGMVLSMCGMEMNAVHAPQIRHPHRTFPMALGMAAWIILGCLIMGSWALIMVVPREEMGFVTGLMQAFDLFLAAFHGSALLPWLGLAILMGNLGSMSNWIIGPTQGLLVAAQDGLLPTKLQLTNARGAPKTLLLYQAVLVSVTTLAFVWFPSINGCYWWLTIMAAQLYMMMYGIMFLAAIKLRCKSATRRRRWGTNLAASLGFIGSTITWGLGFIPSVHIDPSERIAYAWLLVAMNALFCLPVYLLWRHRPVDSVQSQTH